MEVQWRCRSNLEKEEEEKEKEEEGEKEELEVTTIEAKMVPQRQKH